MTTPKIYAFILLFFIVTFANAQNEEIPLDIHVGFGIASGADDFLGRGYTGYVGVEKSIYKNHYAIARYRNASAYKDFYYAGNDRGYNLYSYSNSLDFEYNYRINIWRFQLVPTLGCALRYSKEKLRSSAGVSTDPNGVKSLESIRFREYNGLSVGYSFGLNLNLLVSKYTSIGARYTLQAFTNEHIYNMLSFQIRNNFWKLDKKE